MWCIAGRVNTREPRQLQSRATGRPPVGVSETGQWSCCTFVFVDQAAEDIAAVDLLGGWRSHYGLAG
jgi:hypothetical protein